MVSQPPRFNVIPTFTVNPDTAHAESHQVIAFSETSPLRDATQGSLNSHFHTLRDAKYNLPAFGATLHYAVAFQLLGLIQYAMADGRGDGLLVSLFTTSATQPNYGISYG